MIKSPAIARAKGAIRLIWTRIVRGPLGPMLPMVLILAIPIVPFLLFADSVEAWVEEWRQSPPAKYHVALIVLGLLASDIFLPVPSSVVSAVAGDQLGAFSGTLVTWLGMNLGAMLGFAAAKYGGPTFVRWFSRTADLKRAADLTTRFGPALLAIARGVPVLAEASVLWMGMHRLSWRAFLPPVLASNLALALVYCLIGDKAGLATALAASIAMPILLAAAASRWMSD